MRAGEGAWRRRLQKWTCCPFFPGQSKGPSKFLCTSLAPGVLPVFVWLWPLTSDLCLCPSIFHLSHSKALPLSLDLSFQSSTVHLRNYTWHKIAQMSTGVQWNICVTSFSKPFARRRHLRKRITVTHKRQTTFYVINPVLYSFLHFLNCFLSCHIAFYFIPCLCLSFCSPYSSKDQNNMRWFPVPWNSVPATNPWPSQSLNPTHSPAREVQGL